MVFVGVAVRFFKALMARYGYFELQGYDAVWTPFMISLTVFGEMIPDLAM